MCSIMAERSEKLVGFAGWPDPGAFDDFPGARLVDLDNFFPDVPPAGADIIPQNTCAIIKRVLANGLSLPLDAVVLDDSPGKCDMARMVARVLEDRLEIPVIIAKNENRRGEGTPISDSKLPPREKAQRILDGLTGQAATDDLAYEPRPPAAIWGVPAADLSLYELFPPGSRLLGWFRCLENRTPGLEKLEFEVHPGIPTVFFAQTFCHKNIIARHLSYKYGGLYVDADGVITSSVRAKIEAFLRFNVK